MIYFRSKVYAQKCDRILIGSHDLSVSEQNTDKDTLINNQSSMVKLNRGEDWALVPIENSNFHGASWYTSPDGQKLLVTSVSSIMPPGTVNAATGISAPAKTKFMSQSLILLPSSDRLQVVWAADMQTGKSEHVIN